MMLYGTFFICFATLFFEILSTRTMSFVLGSAYVYFVIGLAMLGMSAAGSFMSMWEMKSDPEKRAKTLFWASAGLGLSFVFVFLTTTYLKQQLNLGLVQHGTGAGLEGIVSHIVTSRFWVSTGIGMLMTLPYFLFGFVLTYIFKSVDSELYNKIYFADLFGAATGAAAAYFFMEYASYTATVVVPVATAIIAGLFFVRTDNSIKVSPLYYSPLILVVLVVWPGSEKLLEPQPQLNVTARDYNFEYNVDELWHGWNSFTHISAIKREKIGDKNYPKNKTFMALGNGEGIATLAEYKEEGYGDWYFEPSKLVMSLGNPGNALVLFAGVGQDMMAINYYADEKIQLTGVELNRKMIEGGLSLPQYNLEKFYARENITLHAEEARAFLERHTEKYGTILLSWSGATTAYYAGAMGHSTQFVYTIEAMDSLFDHLKPNGMIVYMNTNKINSLIMLRQLLAERGMKNPERAALVFYRPGDENAKWTRWWDENRLLIKPSGFTPEEYQQIKTYLNSYGLEVAYSAYEQRNELYTPYWDIMHAKDVAKTVDGINEESNLYFSVITDDRPFSFDLFRFERYFASEFWQRISDGSGTSVYEAERIKRIAFVVAIILGAMILILGPLFFTTGPKANKRTANHLLYFITLGTGFMLIEIGLMQKMVLLLGNPGIAISVVLATLIFATGVGSLMSNKTFARSLSFHRVTLLLLAYLSLFLFLGSKFVYLALPWSLGAKMILVVLILTPAGILMGHLFPQGLRLASVDDKRLVPWAWAINGATSTIAAGIAPLLAQTTGFNWVIIIGMGFYAGILVLPVYRNSKSTDSEGVSNMEVAAKTA